MGRQVMKLVRGLGECLRGGLIPGRSFGQAGAGACTAWRIAAFLGGVQPTSASQASRAAGWNATVTLVNCLCALSANLRTTIAQHTHGAHDSNITVGSPISSALHSSGASPFIGTPAGQPAGLIHLHI